MRNKQNLFATLCLTLLFSVGSAAWSQAAEPMLRVKLGVASQEDGVRAAKARALAAAIAERSENAIEVEVKVYPAQQAAATVYGDLARGVLDMALLEDWSLGARTPAFKLFSMPFLFGSEDKAAYYFRGDAPGKLADSLALEGLRVPGWLRSEPSVFLSAKPLLGRADFSGLRVGGEPNPVFENGLRALGATLIPVPDDDLAKALNAGSVDAVLASLPAIVNGGYPASAKVLTASDMYYPYLAVCVANALFDRISAAARSQITGAVEEEVESGAGKVTSAAAAAKEKLIAAGYTFNMVDNDALRQSMTQVAKEVSVSVGGAGIEEELEQLSKPLLIQ